MNRNIIYSLMLLFISCSSTNLRDTTPNDYEFNNKFVQSKWKYFLNLSDCQKINFVDSIYSIIAYNSYHEYNDPGFIPKEDIDTNLIYMYDKKLENFYYWIFREIELVTKSELNIVVDHYGFYGFTNRQVVPMYSARRALEAFKEDVSRWKVKLNCDSIK